MTYVLILWFSLESVSFGATSPAIAVAEFNNKKACEDAAMYFKQHYRGRPNVACFYKGLKE